MNRPSWRGHLGVRTLIAMAAVLFAGIFIIVIGTAMGAGGVRGIGLVFAIVGLMAIAGLLLRWIVYSGVR